MFTLAVRLSYKNRQLKKLLGLKRQAKSLHASLLEIADLTRLYAEPESFYLQLHEIIANLIKAPNLFVVFKDESSQTYQMHYYASQQCGVLDKPKLATSVIELGLTGYLMRTNKALLCNAQDYQALVENGEILELGQPAHSWMGIPLTLSTGEHGALVIQSHQSDIEFQQQDLTVLTILGQHIAQAIDRFNHQIQLEHEIHSRTRALQKANQALKSEAYFKNQYQLAHKLLLELNESYNFEQPLEHLYQAISDIVAQTISSDLCYIAVQKSKSDWFFPAVQLIDELHCNEQTFHPLNEYFSLDPASILLHGTEVKKLAELGAIKINSDIGAKLDNLTWVAVPVHSEPGELVFIAAVHRLNPREYKYAHLETLEFLATHFNLILQKWYAQAQLKASHRELESMIEERTEKLNQVNVRLSKQIAEKEKAQAQLYHDANHDSLTGLPNRQLFNRNLLNALARYQLTKNAEYCVLFIDLDRFKLINDTFGHLVGDQFLVEVSQKIRACLATQDILSRMGGDEFVILVQGEACIRRAEKIAQNIIATVNVPFSIEDYEIVSGCSIGITTSAIGYNKPADILRDADTAMYQAKSMGRGCYVVFEQSLHERLKAQFLVENEIRSAIRHKQFTLEYQPVVDLTSNEIVALETQLCWQHPKHGLVSVKPYQALAKQAGLFYQIELLALEQVLESLKSQTESGIPETLVCINLDGCLLENEDSLARLIQMLENSQVDLHYLILEFSEKTLSPSETIITAFNQIAETGVRMTLDEFGAQSGSMSLLFKVDIDFVRIDKSLIQTLSDDMQQHRYAQTIVNIGKELGFIVIANGVDNEESLRNANLIGCMFAQGEAIAPVQSLTQTEEGGTRVYFNKSRKLAM